MNVIHMNIKKNYKFIHVQGVAETGWLNAKKLIIFVGDTILLDNH